MQYGVATLDVLAASGILYVLLPDTVTASYRQFLAVYMLAIVAAFITHVPGGLGVLELVVIAILNPSEPHSVMGALLAYRAIYYLGPLAIGLVMLGGHEIMLHTKSTQQAWGVLGKCVPVVAPRIMGFSVFLAGVILLFSGATPAAEGRMALVRRLLPLPLIEVSHFIGSLIGVLLRLGAPPTEKDIDDARRIVAQSRKTASHLALLGDKRFLFNEDRSAFVMYGDEGQSCISMGDPVGPENAAKDLAWISARCVTSADARRCSTKSTKRASRCTWRWA